MSKNLTKLLAAALLVLAQVTAAQAQKNGDDAVLFSVAGSPVKAAEFKYIYGKTNGEKADFSKKSLEEYLDLYTKFKIKVQRAKAMRLDTVQTLQRELDGYRQQLANSYLIDKEVTDKLIDEAYQRSLKDVSVSHIFFVADRNAVPADTLIAYNKAVEAKKKLDGGASFDAVAKEFSDDKSAKDNGGTIGYLVAPFPSGFYSLETAAYTSAAGKVFPTIVRSDMGYHIVKTNAFRDARGEVEVSHILIRKNKERTDAEGRAKIDSLYRLLKNNGDFGELAKQFSEDKGSAGKGGYVGFFGISRYEPAFEDASFGLTKDGEYSPIVETSAGFHLIKRVSRKTVDTYELAKRRLKPRLQKDSRFDLAKTAMVDRIRREGNLLQNPDVLQNFTKTLNAEEFLSHKWHAPEKKSTQTLFTLNNGKVKFTLGDFEEFLDRSSRKRIMLSKNTVLEQAVSQLHKDFMDESCMKYEETQLEAKYPEFKALMREYEEGILLFEATKQAVWDKASQDTVGLTKFFDQQKGKYNWEERATVTIYTVKEENVAKMQEIRDYVTKNPADKVLAKFNEKDKDPLITNSQERTFERGKNKVLDVLKWKEGELSGIEGDKRNKTLNFFKIEKVFPAGAKSLAEARGYAVADYQDFLEKKWMEELQKTYPVVVNKEVLDGLVRK